MPDLPRRSSRVSLSAEVRLRRSQDVPYSVQLRDLSLHGCSIELVNRVHVGERLWIKLPSIESIECFVRWEKEFTAGVDFVAPLHPAVFATLRQRLEP
jgi:hypothetical protein